VVVRVIVGAKQIRLMDEWNAHKLALMFSV
jgi:hypothetical protein